MGKKVDFGVLAVQYIWEHLKELNIGIPTIRIWRNRDLTDPPRETVLFTMTLVPVRERVDDHEETQLPVAILTEDGILRFLIGSGEVDLKLGGGNPFKSIG